MFVHKKYTLNIEFKTNIEDILRYELKLFSSINLLTQKVFNSDLTIYHVRYTLNHELVQNAMLPSEINIVGHQGCCEEK